ncbi:MAG TPA: polysaccharide deacetylase family protein [Bacteroidales bacterium]|nr:polysaccharide deacetylase family protein [Bacteroidales bacterium]
MNQNKINYVLDIFKKIYDTPDLYDYLSYTDCTLTSSGVLVKQSEQSINLFSKNELFDLKTVAYADWDDRSLPFLLNSSSDLIQEVFTVKDNLVIINYDIIAASFYLLSGWQELSPNNYDQHNRFKYSGSIQKVLGFTRIPLVNYYFDILKTALEKFLNKRIKMRSSSIQDIMVFLTHDIDIINRIWFEDTMSSIRKKEFLNIPAIFISGFRGKIQKSLIRKILEIESSLSVKSTFFMLGKKGTTNNIKCADYKLTSKGVREIIAAIRENGSEVALHGSPGTETNRNLLKSELSMIDPEPKGNRFHFLLFKSGNTAAALQAAGIKYDSTLGFAEDIGFRNSFCHPFYLYDIENDRPTEVIEIPLIVMDTTLRRKEYLGSGTQSIEEIRQLIREIKKFGGVFTLLWHNNYFSGYKHSGFREMYGEIIASLKEAEAVFLTGSEISDRYRDF